MDMHTNLSTEEYSIVEEEVVDSTKSEQVRSKHPSTGFPAIYNRRAQREKSGRQDSGNVTRLEGSAREEHETSAPLTFNFSQNDILKLRWTSPLGEDEQDWKDSGSSDTNLHNLRFDFEGLLCDNSNPEEKCRQDDLYFYKGLHHHSDEGEFEGYTVPELMHLSRSSNVSQRCIAIRTLGNIFVKIREYHSFNHQFGRSYHQYLLGYLFGIHRWYKYLTGDLSIHYLLLNMLFHESYASRTAEHSVISLDHLLTGGQFPITSLSDGPPETNSFRLLSYFLTPSELLFELMNEKLAYYPSYFRNNIISQRLEFLNEHASGRSRGVRYNDLQDEDHLIRFYLPDGRDLELLRDVMQEIFKYVPAKYNNSEVSGQKNYLFTFLCKMAQNKGGTLESRVSSINLIRLFIQRECFYDQSICFEAFEGMLVSVGDEMFDFSSLELASQEYSNLSTAKLLFSFVSLVSTYVQSLYNADSGAENSSIKAQQSFLGDFLIKSVLQILRIVILAVLGAGKLNSSSISEYIQLSLVEGVKIIGIMALKDIYLEDLSIYCKNIIHYFSSLDLSDPGQSFVGYHIFTLGSSILLFSQNHEMEYEHQQYIQVLNQIIGKVLRKAQFVGKDDRLSFDESKQFNLVLLSVSMIRFQVLMLERPGSDLTFEALEPYFGLIDFCEKYLETHSKQNFDLDLLTLESGFLLEIEMGMTSIQSILTNRIYGEFFYMILVSTFLKELSCMCLLTRRGEGQLSFYAVQNLRLSIDLLSEMYLRCSRDYSLPNSSRTDNPDLYSQQDQLFRYELCYFEALNMNNDQAVSLSSNVLKKNSIYLQVLNSNMFYLHLFAYRDTECSRSVDTTAGGSSTLGPGSPFISRYHWLISEIEDSSCNSEIPYERLFALLFSSKNLEEYSLALFWILKLQGQISESACDFYNKVLSEYSSHLCVAGLLVFNPFVYSVNIVYHQVTDGAKTMESLYDPFLLSLMRKVLGGRLNSTANSKLINEFVGFLSRYIFECSISQVINISRKKETERNALNLELIGKTVLDYLRFSLELQGKLTARQEESLRANPSLTDSLKDLICGRGQDKVPCNVTMYNLNNKDDNDSLRKLVDLLISVFCDSDMYFSLQTSDCFYFLFTFILIEAISDSEIVMKVLSNIKTVKFLLYNGDRVDISCILERSGPGSTESSEISRDGEVVSLVAEILAAYKDTVSQNTLSVFLVLYLNYFSGSKQELAESIGKLYRETKTEYLRCILDHLNKS